MNIPAQIRAGDTVKWRDVASTDVFGNQVSSGTGWTLTYYLRTNTNHEGATVVGTAYGPVSYTHLTLPTNREV